MPARLEMGAVKMLQTSAKLRKLRRWMHHDGYVAMAELGPQQQSYASLTARNGFVQRLDCTPQLPSSENHEIKNEIPSGYLT